MAEDIQEEEFSSDEELDDEDASDSSSDADAKLEEDEVFDLEFFKCYSAIKKKDDKIYNNDIKFFTEKPKQEDSEGGRDGKDLNDSKKPKMTLLDHQLTLKDEELFDATASLKDLASKSYYEKELDEIKKSIEVETKNIDSDDDDEEFLKVKSDGSTAKPNKPTGSILNKLQNEQDPDVSYLKEFWVDPEKLTDEEKFLRDYIVNKRYIAKNTIEAEQANTGYFSKNLEELSDVEDEGKEKKPIVILDDDHGEKSIVRIPRNSTKTIRDLVEKKKKMEKRLMRREKVKKKKKNLKNADFEDLVGDLPTRFHYCETEPSGLSAVEILMATDDELDNPPSSKKGKNKSKPTEEAPEKSAKAEKKKKKKKRGLNHKKFTKTKVAPDRLLSYGLSKTKLKKLKML